MKPAPDAVFFTLLLLGTLLEQRNWPDAERVRAEDAANQNSKLASSLVSFIDNRFVRSPRHRDGANGWSDRLVDAMRVFTGKYDSQKPAGDQGGSVDLKSTPVSLPPSVAAQHPPRDVYLNEEKPWAGEATPDPTLPDDIMGDITNLPRVEIGTMARPWGNNPPRTSCATACRS